MVPLKYSPQTALPPILSGPLEVTMLPDADWLATSPRDSEILDRMRELRHLPEQANYRDWKAKQLQAYTTIETRENVPDW